MIQAVFWSWCLTFPAVAAATSDEPNPSGALSSPPLSATASTPAAAGNADVAAYVNGQPISRAALDLAVAAAVRNLPLTPRDRQALRTAILNDLIDDKLLEQFLDRARITADPSVLEAQKKALQERLRREQRSLAEYCQQLGASEEQLYQLWALENRWQNYVRTQATDDRLRTFYQIHRERFERSTAHVSHILLRCDPHAGPAERQRLQQRLEKIREQIRSGQLDFATAARRYSHCPSGLSGGDLGILSRHTLPADEPWLQNAFTLPVATLSPVIESAVGFHLFYVHKRQHQPPPPLEECLPEVLDAFAEHLRQQTLEQLRRSAQITIPSPPAP